MVQQKTLAEALEENVKAVRALRTSVLQTTSRLGNFFNPIQILTDSFNRQESIQLKALAAGTTANRFLEGNTEALRNAQSSQVALTQFLIGGFSQGLRNVSQATIDLADEMIITGQNTDGLAAALGLVRFTTGNSVLATADLSQTILRTSKENGVTSQRLVESLQALNEVMTNVSIFGESAVGTFAQLGTALTGRLQGVQGSQQAINRLLTLLSDPLQMASQELLGLRGLSQDLIAGRVNQDQALSRIATAASQLQTGADNPLLVAQLRAALGGSTVNALNLIGQGLENFEGLSEEQKKIQADNLKSMNAFEQNKLKFFNDYAPGIYESVVNTLPQLMMAQAGLQTVQAGRDLQFSGRVGLGRGLKFLGYVPAVLGGLGVLTSFLPTMVDLLRGIKEDGEDPAELARRQLRSNIDNANSLATVGTVIQQFLNRTGQASDNEMLRVAIDKLTSSQEQLTKAINTTPVTPQTN